MSKIVALQNGKGGVCKTTTAINLAVGIARQGYSVVLVDTDPQCSVGNYYDGERCPFKLMFADAEKEIYSCRKMLSSYDYIIIDGAAAISSTTAAAVMVSDVVIIPVTPSPLDFSACGAILAVVEARQEMKPIEARFLITKKISHTRMVEELKAAIADTGIALMRTGTQHRQSYIRTMRDGGSIYDSTDSAAKGEIDNITKEVLELCQSPKWN